MSKQCSATTKSGNPCSRNAVEESQFCKQHMALATAEEAVTTAATTVQDTVEENVAAGAEAVSGAAQTQSERLQEAWSQLTAWVEEIRKDPSSFSMSDFSPEKLYEWINQNVSEFKLPVVSDLSEKLKDTTAEDFRNRETWKEIWIVVNQAVQAEMEQAKNQAESQLSQARERAEGFTEPIINRAQEQLDNLPTFGETRQQINENSVVKGTREFVEGLPGYKEGRDLLEKLPGVATLNSLGDALDKTAPKDLLQSKTWEGFWTVVNHSLSDEMQALRGKKEPTEDEIIEIE